MKKRLIADIPLAIHTRIKQMAAWKNVSMTVYILQAIIEALNRDEKVNE